MDNAHHRWNVKSGAVRSGKTYMDVVKVIPIRLYLGHDKPGLNVFLGNTRGTLQRNIIEPMQEIYGKLVGDISSDNTAVIFGEKVYCLGADKVSQVNRIRGTSIKYGYCDEVVTYSPEVFTMLKSRLDKEYSKCDLTCNTDNPLHWFKQFLDSDADIYLQHYTIDDNPYLPESFKQALKNEYAGTVWYDRYILGKWTIAEGAIYDNYKTTSIRPENPDHIFVGVDYGTSNATVFLALYIKNGIGTIADEYYWDKDIEKRQKSDEEFAEDMLKFLDRQPKRVSKIWVDPSAASYRVALRKRGINSYMAENEVLNGIRSVVSAFSIGVLFIHEDCKNTIKEIQQYVWDPKAQMLGVDKPMKVKDHAMDAKRYVVHGWRKNPPMKMSGSILRR